MNATDTCRSLSIEAALSNLAAIRDFVRQAETALGVDPDTISDTVLAVDEAASNIIRHGYRGQKGEIEIEVCRTGDDLVIRLRDDAASFDPTVVPAPDINVPLTMRRPGGLGIHFMRQTVDEVRHRQKPGGGNELTLVKRGIRRS